MRQAFAPVVVCFAVLTFVFGLAGFSWQHTYTAAASKQAYDFSIPFYKTVQLFLLESGAEDDASHPSNWLLVVARCFAAFLSVVLSVAVTVKFIGSVHSLIKLVIKREHVVICGMGRIGLQLFDDLVDRGEAQNVVVIDKDPENPWLEYVRQQDASVVIGDCTRSITLGEAEIENAKQVFLVNGDDGINLEVAAEVSLLLAEDKKRKPSGDAKLQLHVHISDPYFASTLRPYCDVLRDTPKVTVNVFNVPRAAAAKLVTQELWEFAPKGRSEVSHFVVIGLGPMGQSVALQLAQLAHFPNCKRSRFTIADGNIKEVARDFLRRFPRFTRHDDGELGVKGFSAHTDDWNAGIQCPSETDGPGNGIDFVTNTEFVDLPSGIVDEKFVRLLTDRFSGEEVRPVVFVCGERDQHNFETAIKLRELLMLEKQDDVPIFVWLPRQRGLSEAITRTKDNKIFPFGQSQEAAGYAETTSPMRDNIGMKIQANYERKAVERGDKTEREAWSDIDEEFRESNRTAADHLLIKLAVLGYRLKTQDPSKSEPAKEFNEIPRSKFRLLTEMEHCRWVAERLLSGWKYCDKPSEEEIRQLKQLKQNHNLVPWKCLDEERKKDDDQVKTVLMACQKTYGVEETENPPPHISAQDGNEIQPE